MQATLAKINKRFGAGTLTAFGQRQTFPDMCVPPLRRAPPHPRSAEVDLDTCS